MFREHRRPTIRLAISQWQRRPSLQVRPIRPLTTARPRKTSVGVCTRDLAGAITVEYDQRAVGFHARLHLPMAVRRWLKAIWMRRQDKIFQF